MSLFVSLFYLLICCFWGQQTLTVKKRTGESNHIEVKIIYSIIYKAERQAMELKMILVMQLIEKDL